MTTLKRTFITINTSEAIKTKVEQAARDKGLPTRTLIEKAILAYVGDDPETVKPVTRGKRRGELETVTNGNGCKIAVSPSAGSVKYRLPYDTGPVNRTLPRFVYEQHHGPIPERGRVVTTCGNPRCVNLQHLELRSN